MFIPLQLGFEITYVYTFNAKEDKKDLLDNQVLYSWRCSEPWVVLGDFNLVLKAEDKIDGNAVILLEVIDLQICLEDYGLIEYPTQGTRYTWNDKHDNHRIISKIVSIFINNTWLNIMPVYKALLLPESISDHCASKIILIAWNKLKKSF